MSDQIFSIEPAEAADRDELYIFHKGARYRTDYEFVPDFAEATLKSEYYERFWRAFPDPNGQRQVVKAVMDGKIIGFARFGIADGEEYDPGKLAGYVEGLGELHQLYVDPAYQGRKIGVALYRAAIGGLKEQGYRHMLVATIDANKKAKEFYLKAGAEFHYVYRDYIERGSEVFRKDVAVFVHPDLEKFMI